MLSSRWAVFGLAPAVGLLFALNGCSSSSTPASPGTTQTAGGSGGSTSAGGSSSTAGGTSAGAGGAAAAGTTGTGGAGVAGPCSAAGETYAQCQAAATFGSSNAVPPAPVASAPVGDGTTPNVQAIQYLYVGDADPSDLTTPDTNAWKQFGFDIDGLPDQTGVTNPYHCTGANSAAKLNNILPKGNNGINNSFGKNIVGGLLAALISNPSQTVSQAIGKGSFTILLDIANLGTAGNYSGLNATLAAATAALDSTGAPIPPSFTGSDVWTPYTGNSSVSFPSSYMTNNTWVSGTRGDIDLSLMISSYDIALTIHAAQVSAVYSSDLSKISGGQIGGVLTTSEFVTSIQSVAGKIMTSLCSGTAFASIATTIVAASDILHDGTQDPTQMCDGISIGIGFAGTAAQEGTPVAPAAGTGDPCDGGS